jgi:leucyl/phenylalanyl-tRNA--protein transferase
MSGPGERQRGLRPLDPELLLRASSVGIFPMAEHRTSSDVFWVEPRERGVIPLDKFHCSHSLQKVLRREQFTHTADRAFEQVIRACAASVAGRRDTWINAQIEDAYIRLHGLGHAHSVECWADGELAGGLYGVRIGGAFFGESMFTRRRDASKAAMAHLVARLRVGGFALLDCQFLTPHLATLGAVEVTRELYLEWLSSALALEADFSALDSLSRDLGEGSLSGKLIAQLLTQTS